MTPIPSSRQVGRISASIPREISEYSICRSEIGCVCLRAADRLGADLGEADVADVARLDHLGDRADRLLDRHLGVEAAEPVDVDVVGAEPAQRVGEEVLHRDRAAVDADPAAAGIAQDAELDADHGLRRGRGPRSASRISISLSPIP